MRDGKIACRLIAVPCLLGAFLGCASPQTGQGAPPSPGAGLQPEAKAGMNFQSVQAEMAKLLVGKARTVFLRRPDDGLAPNNFFAPDSVVIQPHRLRLSFTRKGVWELQHESLVGEEISVRPGTGTESSYSIIKISNFAWSFVATDRDSARRFVDDLRFLQQQAKADSAGNPALEITPEFQVRAAEYRAAAVKPPVTEAQRRCIVQANVLSQGKDYQGALDLYRKALEVDPVAYPGCYFNMALLTVELGRYGAGILLMQKYLLLVPDAKDARAAQDKIYEWEILMQKA
jgi:tetratricopeptide (TPR) repeat protein